MRFWRRTGFQSGHAVGVDERTYVFDDRIVDLEEVLGGLRVHATSCP